MSTTFVVILYAVPFCIALIGVALIVEAFASARSSNQVLPPKRYTREELEAARAQARGEARGWPHAAAGERRAVMPSAERNADKRSSELQPQN